MSKKIYLFVFLLILLIMLIPNIVKAGQTENGLYYTVQEDGVHIRDFQHTSIEGEIVIPSEIEGTIVTTIEKKAFVNCEKITSIYIPRTIRYIENENYNADAFYGCINLTEFKVDNENMYYTSENGVLYNKDKTHIIRYPEGKKENTYTLLDTTEIIENCAFANCCNLENIIIPNGLIEINTYSFYNCGKLSAINLPNSIKTIDKFSFIRCKSLKSILIPSSVEEIGLNPFCYECDNLETILVENTNEYYASEEGILLNKEKDTIIAFPNGKNVDTYIFTDNIKSIGDFAFGGCSNLTEMIIPNTINDIGGYAFTNCSNLIKVIIPNSITEIKSNTFESCINLKTITIPSSVNIIGNNVFDECNNLELLYVDKDSYAEQYAIANNLNYEYISKGIIKDVNFINLKELNVNNKKCLVNFDIKNNTVNDIINSESEALDEGDTLKFYKGDIEITGDAKVGTGTIIKVMTGNAIIDEYVVLIYGDTTGNGNPSAVDALAIVKNKLGIVKFENEIYEEAGRVAEATRNSKSEPSAVDALAIVKYKLNIGTIEQQY